MRVVKSAVVGSVMSAACMATTAASAFCGFYVAPEDGPLYNDATQVALMREGTRTAISMSNNYKGPAKDFAMVVPVPVVLQKENVKTFPLDVFKKLEQLSAPRLVEYWEQDPCMQEVDELKAAMGSAGAGPGGGGSAEGATRSNLRSRLRRSLRLASTRLSY